MNSRSNTTLPTSTQRSDGYDIVMVGGGMAGLTLVARIIKT